MTPLQVSDVLEAVEYKPGWKLSWSFWWDGKGVDVHWIMAVPDAYNPALDVVFPGAVHSFKFEKMDEEGLIRELFRMALRCEQHECAEFFKYKGDRVFDPHRSVLTEGNKYE